MTVHAKDLSGLLEPVRGLADEAGKRVMEIYDQAAVCSVAKGDGSPLTAADLAAHEIILAGLTRLGGGYPVLSEESAAVPYDERRAWTTYWLVDPLDGTKEFLERNGEFTVNIALLDGGEPVLGVVAAPALRTTYWAARGSGAFVRRASETTRIRVGPEHEPLRVGVSRSHGGPELAGFLGRLGAHEAFAMGSSLKICLVAEARLDLYPRLGPTCEWDVGAADAILTEAGGLVCDPDGKPLGYNKPQVLNPWFVAAASPALRDRALAALRAENAPA